MARERYNKSPKQRTVQAAWCRANPDKVAAYEAKRKGKRTAYRHTYNKAYYVKNTAKMKAQSAEQRRRNPEYHKLSVIRWRKENPQRFQMHLMRRDKRARDAGPVSEATLDRIALQTHCTYCDCELSDKPGPTQRTLDHILALARGGTNHDSNLTGACRTCNFSKHDRILLYEWLPSCVVRDRSFTPEEIEEYQIEEVARQRALLTETPSSEAT